MLGGDWNFTPDSAMYTLVTKGSVDPASPALPSPLPGSDWSLSLTKPLASAYALANGVEPEFTNYTESVNGPFVGTLDFLFVSEGVSVAGVDALPSKADAEPSPSQHVPSDHWPIAANFVISPAK